MRPFTSVGCGCAFLASLGALPMPAVRAQGVAMSAVLVGGNEVSAAGIADVGDTNGFGTATFIVHPTPADPNNEQICFALTVRAIDGPTVAHIHSGRAGIPGPIAVALAPVPIAGNPGTSSGCVNAPNVLVRNLISRPSNYYVNVHTGAFPAGALRGQLF